MKKMSLSLIAAGLLAGGAGLAQAETVLLQDGSSLHGHTVVSTVAPNGQKTYWIDTPVLTGSVIPGAAPVATIDNTPMATLAIAESTTVLGAGPSTVIMPADTTVLGAGPVMVPLEPVMVPPGLAADSPERHDASATFNVPGRAGEASTMTNGAPNLETIN